MVQQRHDGGTTKVVKKEKKRKKIERVIEGGWEGEGRGGIDDGDDDDGGIGDDGFTEVEWRRFQKNKNEKINPKRKKKNEGGGEDKPVHAIYQQIY